MLLLERNLRDLDEIKRKKNQVRIEELKITFSRLKNEFDLITDFASIHNTTVLQKSTTVCRIGRSEVAIFYT